MPDDSINLIVSIPDAVRRFSLARLWCEGQVFGVGETGDFACDTLCLSCNGASGIAGNAIP